MTLKSKLYIFMSVLFIIFSTLVWVYSGMLFDNINEEWAKRFIKKQIVFDKNRTLLPILHELEMVKKMADDSALKAMALDDTQPLTQARGIEALERYRALLQNHVYFAAFVKSENYYFNDANNTYAGKEFRYKLSALNTNDTWFYQVIEQDKPFQINVDVDKQMGHIKVWINYLLKDGDQTLGVVGTGFDFNRFIDESVGIEQEGVRNFMVDPSGMVQLARDTLLIDYNHLTNNNGQHKTLENIFTHKGDVALIRRAFKELKEHPGNIKTLWVQYEGQKHVLGVVYLPEIDWFNLTLIDSKELIILKDFTILPMLSVLFLVALLSVGIELHALILHPLSKLKYAMQEVENGHYGVDFSLVGTAEIADLSRQFRDMVSYVQNNNQLLEEKIQDRTRGLQQSENKLNTILDTVEAFIYIKDAQYRYLYANKKTCEYFQKDLDAIIAQEDEAFFDAKTAQILRRHDQEVIEFGRKVSYEEINTLQDGQTQVFLSTKIPLFREDGSVYALCGISTDITERKKQEEIIKGLAFHDILTQLPNRRLFDERFAMILKLCKRTYKYGAFLVSDLDNFKPLNDIYGHKAGDLLLIEVANRLRNCIRESDVAARFGGDEFVVALSELDENRIVAFQEAQKIAFKILVQLGRPYVLAFEREDGQSQTIEYRCTASIGLTLFGHDKQDKEHVFREADRAMYEAKQKGRNRIEFYEEFKG